MHLCRVPKRSFTEQSQRILTRCLLREQNHSISLPQPFQRESVLHTGCETARNIQTSSLNVTKTSSSRCIQEILSSPVLVVIFAGITLSPCSFPSPQEPHFWLLAAPGLAFGFPSGVLRLPSHLQILHWRALSSLELALCCAPELLPSLGCISAASSSTAACRGDALVVTPVCPPALPQVGVFPAGFMAGRFSSVSWSCCSSELLTIPCTTDGECKVFSFLFLPCSLLCSPAAAPWGFSFSEGLTLLQKLPPWAGWAVGTSGTSVFSSAGSLSNLLNFLHQYLLWLMSFPMVRADPAPGNPEGLGTSRAFRSTLRSSSQPC